MDIIFLNCENNKTFVLQTLLLDLDDKINLKRSDKTSIKSFLFHDELLLFSTRAFSRLFSLLSLKY